MSQDRGSFIWYELMTDDVDGARTFYREVVGWNIADDGQPMPDGSSYRMIARSDGGFAGGVLELTADMKADGASPGWLGYIHHPDVDGAVETLRQAGGAVHMPPADMEGVGRIAMVSDPQGAVFYIMNPVPPAGDQEVQSDVFSPDRPQHIRWNDLQTTDPHGAIALYTGLFGWEQKESMPMGELGDYSFFHHGERMIGAVMPKMPGTPRPVWSFYIGVDDIDRAAGAVRDSGGAIRGEITEIPGGEFSIDATDPQGAGIGLVGPRIR